MSSEPTLLVQEAEDCAGSRRVTEGALDTWIGFQKPHLALADSAASFITLVSGAPCRSLRLPSRHGSLQRWELDA